jgi:hypothetical protein
VRILATARLTTIKCVATQPSGAKKIVLQATVAALDETPESASGGTRNARIRAMSSGSHHAIPGKWSVLETRRWFVSTLSFTAISIRSVMQGKMRKIA